jgi:hypothetical protein
MSRKIWYAVSGKGQGRVFTSKPERDEHWKLWLAESVGCISMTVMLLESEGVIELPHLTWKDEPVELEISISLCHG